ncbi:hypothetical protein A5819_003440 [Enterococcus sp. 7E2_DIV0204]|uniref:hypothetical protein n=1 Tax=unclassified Enterococcus TaxID=2608891 RepID=UPI000A33BF17|nr:MULTISPECIES: hypothetical protein [unclassified Enterococcus]OTN86590.1 hypothetical protein A5819_003440 [Enterococcus sp. 7E2_DIV0204]OTP47621.1 hypothetical protein A5884_003376 [Enterococcus sp. 7D2_DIV0200]
MDIVESFYQEMKQTYPGINRSDCEEAIQIALVKTTNSLWKIVKQQRNEIKCRDVKRMAKLPISEPPSHIVKETKDSFSIDDFELDYVLENGVTVQQLGKDIVQVNVTFLAKSYDYEFKE